MAHAPPVQSGFSEAHLARSPAGKSGGGAGRGREQIVVAGATYRRGSVATWRAGCSVEVWAADARPWPFGGWSGDVGDGVAVMAL